MNGPLVTVVIPAYRAAEYLPDTVARLARQEFADFEVVIVEDGSGDETADVARGLDRRYERVRAIVLSVNGGVARARRRAVDEATGEYLWFVDADDTWPDDALVILADLARESRADVVVAGAEFVYQDGGRRPIAAPQSAPVTGPEAFGMLLRGELTGHLWNKLFRRSVMQQCSFAPARVQSDLIMVADALSHADRVVFSPSSVYEYRLRPGSIITSTSKRAESLAIIDEAVRADAERLGLTASEDYRYFRARYIQLSGIKDALLAPYDPVERAAHLSARRRSLTAADVWLFARRRDARRFALAATAKTSVRAHRALLKAAER
ncbi:MAG TPA: glycosyltransferase family 2 protein [Microbacterium sp.]|uniref:glycosyltransferase family 2 protein n=1 Tax=Microbacterium sp. TaxID=51671 RepID=UPI002B7B62D1|nr:glycosyltransferase family 2 protein [Microbacterium sp.]HWI31652.1 glycosyltransferase family 2 protein [Microbacterium sp.]